MSRGKPVSHTPRAFSVFDSDWQPALRCVRVARERKSLRNTLKIKMMDKTMKIFFARTFAIALVLILSATGLWAAGAEEEPAAAAEKEMVTDPTTGEMVTAPEYGGTLHLAHEGWYFDIRDAFYGRMHGVNEGVLEKLGMKNWAIDRDEYDFTGYYTPVSALTGMLAESWSQPDPLTYVFKIRQGVHWHNKPPMNGREFTADDVEYNYQRLTGLGKFSETEPTPMGPWSTLPFESITATDKWTVVFKLTEPNLTVLKILIYDGNALIYPPEVIEETRTAEVPQGKFSDWRDLVGTGPYMLTDVVVGSSHTYTKNPEYWGYDEKYPENRLPYIDEIRSLVMTDVATRLSALRTGKVDYLGVASAYSVIKTIDDADSLRQTRPEIQLWPQRSRSTNAFALPVNKPPFDDIRVRHAMQMALDLETINDTFYKGLGETTPFGQSAVKGYYIPFEEWPEEVKKTYRYDPAGAEALLDAAGYPRGADGIRFKTVVNHHGAFDASYKEIAVSYWAEIGVDVDILVWGRCYI